MKRQRDAITHTPLQGHIRSNVAACPSQALIASLQGSSRISSTVLHLVRRQQRQQFHRPHVCKHGAARYHAETSKDDWRPSCHHQLGDFTDHASALACADCTETASCCVPDGMVHRQRHFVQDLKHALHKGSDQPMTMHS